MTAVVDTGTVVPAAPRWATWAAIAVFAASAAGGVIGLVSAPRRIPSGPGPAPVLTAAVPSSACAARATALLNAALAWQEALDLARVGLVVDADERRPFDAVAARHWVRIDAVDAARRRVDAVVAGWRHAHALHVPWDPATLERWERWLDAEADHVPEARPWAVPELNEALDPAPLAMARAGGRCRTAPGVRRPLQGHLEPLAGPRG